MSADAEPELAFNPFTPEMAANPHSTYRRMRETEPVHRSPLGFWCLFRHADVFAFSKERTLSMNFVEQNIMVRGPEIVDEFFMTVLTDMLGFIDPPRHGKVRRLMAPPFVPSRISGLSTQVQEMADRLLDRVESKREMDLVADFATPLPAFVIGKFLGIPESDYLRIAEAAEKMMTVVQWQPLTDEQRTMGNDCAHLLVDYFADQIARRRAQPQDDYLTDMIRATDDAGRLSEGELIANAILMYVAGHDTTAATIGIDVLNLHRNPDQLDLLRQRPELITTAVDELSRFDPQVALQVRHVTEPTTLGGIDMATGDAVLGVVAAGSRDPEKYPDPDRLDITRTVEDLLLFGVGTRSCVGQHLARLEIRIALNTLLHRLPDLEVIDLDPPWKSDPIVRGLQSLPVRW